MKRTVKPHEQLSQRTAPVAIKRSMEGSASALMLFGSRARGDFVAASDVDVLQVTDRRMSSYKAGIFTFSPYSLATLSYLAAHGSLFILHLKTDGRILEDAAGQLNDLLDLYIQPRTYDYFRSQLRGALPLLDCTLFEYESRWRTLHTIAIFLLRSTCYAACVEAGEPKFGMTEVARVLHDPRLTEAYQLKFSHKPARRSYLAVGKLIAEYLRTHLKNPYGSMEGYVVVEASRYKLVKAFGLKLLDSTDNDSDTYGVEVQRMEDLLCPLP